MPRLPRLFIDKLAITIPLEGARGADVRQTINDSFEWTDCISPANPRSRRYPDNFSFTTPDDHVASLFLRAGGGRNNHLRLEYSPNNFGESGRALLGDFLRNILGDDYLADVQGARLTRLDVAFDVRRIPLKDLMIIDLRSRKSSIIRGKQGEAESYYFPFKGTNQLCVYDKLSRDSGCERVAPSKSTASRMGSFRVQVSKTEGLYLGGCCREDGKSIS